MLPSFLCGNCYRELTALVGPYVEELYRLLCGRLSIYYDLPAGRRSWVCHRVLVSSRRKGKPNDERRHEQVVSRRRATRRV